MAKQLGDGTCATVTPRSRRARGEKPVIDKTKDVVREIITYLFNLREEEPRLPGGAIYREDPYDVLYDASLPDYRPLPMTRLQKLVLLLLCVAGFYAGTLLRRAHVRYLESVSDEAQKALFMSWNNQTKIEYFQQGIQALRKNYDEQISELQQKIKTEALDAEIANVCTQKIASFQKKKTAAIEHLEEEIRKLQKNQEKQGKTEAPPARAAQEVEGATASTPNVAAPAPPGQDTRPQMEVNAAETLTSGFLQSLERKLLCGGMCSSCLRLFRHRLFQAVRVCPQGLR